jgi:hypothetical protein
MITHKQDTTAGVIDVELSYVPTTYEPVGVEERARRRRAPGSVVFAQHDENGGAPKTGLYGWEAVFWGYVLAVHATVLVTVTSPVDIFDTVVMVLFSVGCLAYLCRPRAQPRRPGDGDDDEEAFRASRPMVDPDSPVVHTTVLGTLMIATWLGFTSIPHAYEHDRLWFFSGLVCLDALLLVVHMYDTMPTMYTIVMGRLTYVTVFNALMAASFCLLRHRLSHYIREGRETGGGG